MLEPRRKEKELPRRGLEGDTRSGADPRQIDSDRFVHGDSRTARIVEDDLPSSHVRRDLHVVRRRQKAPRVAMEEVVVARAVDVDPPLKDEAVVPFALLGTEVIEE